MPVTRRYATRYMDRVAAEGISARPRRRLLANQRTLRKLFGNRLTVIGIVIFLVLLIATILAPVIAPYNPQTIDLNATLSPPSFQHLFGTDRTGRDVLSRVLYGGQVSITIGLGSALGAAIIGGFLGLLSGYLRGPLDAVLLRVSELFMAFPQLVIVLVLVSIVGQSAFNLVVIFFLTGWGGIYRLARSLALSIREEEYILAQKAMGTRTITIALAEILPNAIGPIAVNITLSTAMFILQEAALSFLGLGVPLATPTWGNILNAAKDLSVLQTNWWIWLPVGAVISAFVLSINLIGDGLRDATDPNQQG